MSLPYETTSIRAKFIIPIDSIDQTPLRVISDGVVVWNNSDGRILFVDSWEEIDLIKYSNTMLIHLPHHCLMPGLVNCHTHSAMSLLKGYADDLPLKTWLNDYIWPTEGKFMSPDFVRVGSSCAVDEMLRTGTTTFLDMYFEPEETAKICENKHIRGLMGPPILDFGVGNVEEVIEKSFKFILDHIDCEYVDPILNIHSIYMCRESWVKEIAEKLREFETEKGIKITVNIHLHETTDELKLVTDANNGQTAIDILDKYGLLTPRLVCAHCVYLTDDELNLLVRRGVKFVHCPKSNAKLSSGFANVPRMLNECKKYKNRRLSINSEVEYIPRETDHNFSIVSLGTDSACSNNSLSMFSEMNFAALIGKGLNPGNADLLPAHTALKMGTLYGAMTVQKDMDIGSISVGKFADIVAVRMSSDRTHQPAYDIVSAIVYDGCHRFVDFVWVKGEEVVRKGVVISGDRITTNAEVDKYIKELTDYKSTLCPK